MKEIKREHYLNKLISSRENGLIKVLTGIKDCGKSYLLDPIFKNYLLSTGVREDHIIKLDLDKKENIKYHDPTKLNDYIMKNIKDNETHYIFLNEIQVVNDFEFVLNGFLYQPNLDVYVTGSNSKYLSTDVITEFRGRSTKINVYPLSFQEFLESCNDDKYKAWQEYKTYGGMPLVLFQETKEEKLNYLKNISKSKVPIINSITSELSISLNQLTNSNKIFKAINSNKKISLSTINSYLNNIENSFIINKVKRYDIKRKKYLKTSSKYYFQDIGLYNAIIGYDQKDNDNVMENIIYNELLTRDFEIDIGTIETREKPKKHRAETGFICNLGYKRYYIKYVPHLNTREETLKEESLFMKIKDNFKKVIAVNDTLKHYYTEEGILIIGIVEFLQNKNSLDL